jgi:transposase InsO family protein
MKLDYPIERLCQVLEVSVSGYYDWAKREIVPGPRAREDRDLAQQIANLHLRSRQTYGSPRIVAALRTHGRRHGRNRVARLMRLQGLRGRQPSRYRPQTTDSRHPHPIAPNRLKEVGVPAAPNRVWVADITYIPTRQGWLYLAAVLDLFSRRIVGWAMSSSIDSALVLQSLTMALRHRRPNTGLIFHSDRGVQYAAGSFRDALTQAGLLASMSRTGNCYDNAAMESFWSTLKLEMVYRQDFDSHEQARRKIFDYIETFYNRERLHTALAAKSPAAFETAAGEAEPTRQRSPMGVEPLKAEAKQTDVRGHQRATGAPSGGAAGTFTHDQPLTLKFIPTHYSLNSTQQNQD